MKVSDILSDESKWIKGKDQDDKGRMCLRTAVFHVYHTSRSGAFEALTEVIMTLYPGRMRHSLITFNDHPDTTFEDIQRVLKVADV